MECYAKSYCKLHNTPRCNEICDYKIVLDTLYNLSNMPKRYRHDIPLQPEKIDLQAFHQLKDFKDGIAANIENGNWIYIFSKVTGTGKAQPLYSKILSENGLITMGEVQVGTRVYNERGDLSTVTGVYPQGKKEVYRLTFSDGSTTECCKEHLWEFILYTGKKKVFELQDILNKPLYKQEKHAKRWLFSVPITQPIKFKKQQLPLNPYILGVLLGDGALSGSTPILSNSESDIISKVSHLLSDTHKLVSINDISYRIVDKLPTTNTGKFRSNRLTEHLRELGLFGTKSNTKFIPNIYLHSDIRDRLELLQGLIDTDGHVMNKGGFVEYVTVSSKLAEQIKFLVQSLGGTCSLTTKRSKYTYNGELKEGKLAYKLGIKLPKEFTPFTSKKHCSKVDIGTRQREPYRKLQKIEFIGVEECQCIMVDNPTHLYLTDNLIVTHNTSWACKFVNDYFRYLLRESKFELENKALYLNTNIFLEQLRSSFDGDTSEVQMLLNRAYKCDLLILDDIGVERGTPWTQERLYDLINTRYNECKCTIFTSNLSPTEIEDKLGIRIASRIRSSKVIELKGADRRGGI